MSPTRNGSGFGASTTRFCCGGLWSSMLTISEKTEIILTCLMNNYNHIFSTIRHQAHCRQIEHQASFRGTKNLYPAKSPLWPIAGLKLTHRLRFWPNMRPALDQRSLSIMCRKIPDALSIEYSLGICSVHDYYRSNCWKIFILMNKWTSLQFNYMSAKHPPQTNLSIAVVFHLV